MPLFNYQCLECNLVVEKFQHRLGDIKMKCKKCGNEKFQRVFGTVYSRVWLNAKDTFDNKISPDADRIRKNIANGSDKDFVDVAGD